MKDVELKEIQMIYYPLEVGVTSKAYWKQKTLIFNDLQTLKRCDFVNAIDNPKDV
jgi:hypothetical protein